MTEAEVAAYKEQVFSSNGHTPTQPSKPEAQKVETPKPTETPVETPEKVAETPNTPAKTEEEEIVDPTDYLKQELGFESWEAAKAATEELKQLREAAKTPKQLEYANEQSKAVAEALAAGKLDDVYEILDTQKRISDIDKMSAKDAIKLQIQLKNKDYKSVDIEDVFEEKYTYPDKPVQYENEKDDEREDDKDFEVRMDKWKAQKEKIDRRIERDSITAKSELSKLKTELKFPEINKAATPDAETLKKHQQEELAVEEMKKSDKEFFSKLSPKDISMVFKFNDEANKLAFDIGYEPEKDAFDKAVMEASDLTKFFENYYDKDGSPDRVKLLRELYAGRNIEKIVSEAIVAATNQTKIWFLSNQKNIGDRTQKMYALPPESDVDKLRKQVFG